MTIRVVTALTLVGMVSFNLIAEVDAALPEKRFNCDD